jgi:hypothetical protein
LKIIFKKAEQKIVQLFLFILIFLASMTCQTMFWATANLKYSRSDRLQAAATSK